MSKLRAGLIQMALKASTDADPETIRQAMIAAHIPLIEQAGEQGVQVLCFQEVFTQPYFCPSQDAKWYESAESIPDGPTTQLMQTYAAKYRMVIVVPIYERDDVSGVYYNTAAVIDADGKYLGKYRKTHIPQVAGFWEKFFFKPGASHWPVFQTQYCNIVNPSATVAGLSEYLWKLEQPASAAANGCWIGAINRVGTEAPWNIGEFYGQSYFVNPRGQIEKIASRDQDELIVHDLDMELVRTVRNTWQFFRDRRPETYTRLTDGE
ncbi:MAG: acyltransferase [Gammaproteobacteria bacterium HGW-Gammaproteobacteria-2]|nr:MAG: acyltransferase [Gammaproteobacteria bacterium HGW-Gammaproteobacteria-2]